MAELNWAVPPKYDGILDAADGYAIAVRDKRAGVVNLRDEVVVPFEFDPMPDGWRQPNATLRGIAVLQKCVGELFIFDLSTGKKFDGAPFQEVHFRQDDHFRGAILVKKGEKYGLLSYSGQLVLPFDFDKLFPADNIKTGEWGGRIPGDQSFFTGIIGDQAALYQTDGTQVLPHEFVHLELAIADNVRCIAAKKRISDMPMRILEDFYDPKTGNVQPRERWIPTEKWGLLDFDGAVLLPFEYDNILYAGKNRFVVLQHALQYVWYGSKREEMFAKEDHEVLRQIRLGVVAAHGEVIVPVTGLLRYHALQFNNDGFLPISTEAGFGAMNLSGEIAVQPAQRNLQVNLSDGMFEDEKVIGDGSAIQWKYGFRNADNELVIPHIFDRVIAPFRLGKAVVVQKKNTLIIDKTGKHLFKFENCGAETVAGTPLLLLHFTNPKKQKRLWGVFDVQAGRFLIENDYKAIETSHFRKGRFFIATNLEGKKGFLDANGKPITDCQFAEANPFSEGVALVKMDGKFGFVDRLGEMAFPCELKSATDFTNGVAIASIGKKFGLLVQQPVP